MYWFWSGLGGLDDTTGYSYSATVKRQLLTSPTGRLTVLKHSCSPDIYCGNTNSRNTLQLWRLHLSIFSSSEPFGEPGPETSGASPVSSECTVTKTQRKNSPNRAGTLTTHRRSNGNKNLNISGAIFPWRIKAGGVERCAQDMRGRKTGFVFQIHFRSSEDPRD